MSHEGDNTHQQSPIDALVRIHATKEQSGDPLVLEELLHRRSVSPHATQAILMGTPQKVTREVRCAK